MTTRKVVIPDWLPAQLANGPQAWPVRGSFVPVPIQNRFWQKVDASGDCWEWLACRNPQGYGIIRSDGRNDRAHRVAWELLCGPIPSGYYVDHLCRNRGCVNPDHLEPVAKRINDLRGYSPMAKQARKERCLRGHDFTQENTIRRPRGGRECRSCTRVLQRIRWRRWKANHS